MPGFFTDFRTRSRGRWGLWTVAAVCLVLLVMLAAVQVAHVHTQASDADHCALCIAMHSAAPVAAAAALVIFVRLQTALPAPEACPVPRRRTARHTTRPPPQG